MRLITQEYGQPCELVESTLEEFYVMKELLKRNGAEARLVSRYCNSCVWQIRNNYKEEVDMKRGISSVCDRIIKTVEADIESGHWCR